MREIHNKCGHIVKRGESNPIYALPASLSFYDFSTMKRPKATITTEFFPARLITLMSAVRTEREIRLKAFA